MITLGQIKSIISKSTEDYWNSVPNLSEEDERVTSDDCLTYVSKAMLEVLGEHEQRSLDAMCEHFHEKMDKAIREINQ